MKRKIIVMGLLLTLGISLFLGWDLSAGSWSYALSRRIPKVIAILFTGSAIAVSSQLFQTVSGNRILTPSVLGLDSLYVFIQTAMIFALGSSAIARLGERLVFLIAAAAMVVFSVGLLSGVLKRLGGNLYLLLLVGIVTGTLFRSGSSFLQIIIDPNEFLIVQGSLFASFNNINIAILALAGLMMGMAMAFALVRHRELDVLALGRETALNLGIDHPRLVRQVLLVVALLVSVSTALVGPITFLGVLVTNLTREYLQTSRHLYLLIGSMLTSGIALIFGQFLVEQIFAFNTPVSVLINFAGGLYFIILLLKESQVSS